MITTLVAGDSIMFVLSIIATVFICTIIGIHTHLCIRTLKLLKSPNSCKQNKPQIGDNNNPTNDADDGKPQFSSSSPLTSFNTGKPNEKHTKNDSDE
ncbi:hypothetical protein ES703_77109 [subsurface metagenome]